MTGPEHYAEAERLLCSQVGDPVALLAAAQVHATLALTAATIEAAATRTWPGGDTYPSDTYPHSDKAWQSVTS